MMALVLVAPRLVGMLWVRRTKEIKGVLLNVGSAFLGDGKSLVLFVRGKVQLFFYSDFRGMDGSC